MTLSSTEYRMGLGKKEASLILNLSERDLAVFTIKDAQNLIGPSAKEVIRGLAKKKWVLRIKRGLYVVVPLDIGVKGADAFLMHEFVIASFLVDPYYVSYWSALNYHGFTDQIPRTTFVATTIPKHTIEILNTKYRFIKLSPKKFFGLVKIDIGSRQICISSPEKTIADCLDHPEHCGGIEQIARPIYFYHRELHFEQLIEQAKRMGNNTVLKRLGYILDRTGILEEYKDHFSDFKPKQGYPKLDPLSSRKGKHNGHWKLLVNFSLDQEEWNY